MLFKYRINFERVTHGGGILFQEVKRDGLRISQKKFPAVKKVIVKISFKIKIASKKFQL